MNLQFTVMHEKQKTQIFLIKYLKQHQKGLTNI